MASVLLKRPAKVPPQAPTLFTLEEVARIFRVTRVTIHAWIKKGLFPAGLIAGAHPRWSREQLDAVLSGRRS
jgi:hypothetical protein